MHQPAPFTSAQNNTFCQKHTLLQPAPCVSVGYAIPYLSPPPPAVAGDRSLMVDSAKTTVSRLWARSPSAEAEAAEALAAAEIGR